MRYITRIISNRRSALDFTRQLVFRRDLYAGTHLLTIIIIPLTSLGLSHHDEE
ncbi:hypothetical protein K470DRAFT_113283 [Piedraia hortae CBS 480.64]|uniref:Uncharacterized protein n=1 Tax=Piedraia hortae CBS 480.64 TaxID=1314780 RepID=A0A6A7BWD0_9PEZI|nr:hypothetical protein K470DRAFT_113283 [Piedraia hortae CBS 480.64]